MVPIGTLIKPYLYLRVTSTNIHFVESGSKNSNREFVIHTNSYCNITIICSENKILWKIKNVFCSPPNHKVLTNTIKIQRCHICRNTVNYLSLSQKDCKSRSHNTFSTMEMSQFKEKTISMLFICHLK